MATPGWLPSITPLARSANPPAKTVPWRSTPSLASHDVIPGLGPPRWGKFFGGHDLHRIDVTRRRCRAQLRHRREPGLSTNPTRPRFLLFGQKGDAINGTVRKWIDSLVIPPAWTDVWISPDTSGHILATGYDKAGRKQYIYHPVWEETRDEVKFERMGEFGQRLARLRRRTDSECRARVSPD